jgi:hypothetical protein
MLPADFEPAIPESERQQTHALDSAATGIGFQHLGYVILIKSRKGALHKMLAALLEKEEKIIDRKFELDPI